MSSVRTAVWSSSVRMIWVSCSRWAASWSRIAVIGSLLVMSVPQEVAGGQPAGQVAGYDRFGPPGGGREFTGGLGQVAGAAVGGVAPGAGQPGDDRGAAAADDQGEPGG